MRRAILALAACLLATPALAREGGAGTIGDMRQVAAGARGVVAEAERHLGQGNFTGRPGAWCAAFVSAVLRATGHRPLPSGLAASALAYGPRTASPRPGDLAVTSRHVGIVEAVNNDGTVTTINGNWTHRVRRARIARAGLIFVRV